MKEPHEERDSEKEEEATDLGQGFNRSLTVPNLLNHNRIYEDLKR
jgi:hypothetical protein